MKRILIFSLCLIGMMAISANAAVQVAVEENGKVYGLSVLNKSEFQERIDYFNKDLTWRNLSGTIEKCDMIIDIPLGSMNHFYGGACTLVEDDKRDYTMICTNLMTDADFKIQTVGPGDLTLNRLVSFVVKNCIH